MKKTLSVVMAVVLAVMCCAAFTGCTQTEGKYKIGICQLITHTALDAATEGFKQAVIDKLGAENVVFDYQNAAGDSNTCATIINSFVNKKVDLIMANATPALQAAANATETIPVLGTSITEYGVALGIDNFNGVVGGNISGTSDLAPLDEQCEAMMELFPSAKIIGLLYCSAEPNSEYQVKVVEEYLAGKSIETKRYSFSDSNDIAAVLNTAVAWADAMYIPTDNTAANSIETIGQILLEAGIPAFAGEAGLCDAGAVATLSISYYDLGYKTGEMAADILTDKADISTMQIAYAPASKMYNSDLCNKFGVTVPEGYTDLYKAD